MSLMGKLSHLSLSLWEGWKDNNYSLALPLFSPLSSREERNPFPFHVTKYNRVMDAVKLDLTVATM